MELALIGVVLLAGKFLNDKKKGNSVETAAVSTAAEAETENGGLLAVSTETDSILPEISIPNRNISDFKLNTFANNQVLKKKDVVVNDLSKLQKQSKVSNSHDSEKLRQLKADYTNSNNGEKKFSLPFEQVKVNKDDLNRDVRITPKTIDETRLNPKVQHNTRLNAGRHVIEKEQMTKITEKRKPDQFVHADVGTFTVPTAQIKKDMMNGELKVSSTNRQSTTSEYMGNGYMAKSTQMEQEYNPSSSSQFQNDFQTNIYQESKAKQRDVNFLDSLKGSLSSLNPMNYVSRSDTYTKASDNSGEYTAGRNDNNQNTISNLTTVNKNLINMSEIIPSNKQSVMIQNNNLNLITKNNRQDISTTLKEHFSLATQNTNAIYNEKNTTFVPEMQLRDDNYNYTIGAETVSMDKGKSLATFGETSFANDHNKTPSTQIIENQPQNYVRDSSVFNLVGKEDIMGEIYGKDIRTTQNGQVRNIELGQTAKEASLREVYGNDLRRNKNEQLRNHELELTTKDTTLREVYGNDLRRSKNEQLRNHELELTTKDTTLRREVYGNDIQRSKNEQLRNQELEHTMKDQLVRELFGQDLAFGSKQHIRNEDFSFKNEVNFENYGNLSLVSKETLRNIDNESLGATLKEQINYKEYKNVNLVTKELIRNMDNSTLGATVKEMSMKSVMGSNIGTPTTITIRDESIFNMNHDATKNQEISSNLDLKKKSRIFDYNQRLVNANKEHRNNYIAVDSISKKDSYLLQDNFELPYTSKEHTSCNSYIGNAQKELDGQYIINANTIEAPYTIKQEKTSYLGNGKGMEQHMSYEASENITGVDKDSIMKLRNPNMVGNFVSKDSTFNGATEIRLGHLTLPEYKAVEISNKEERNKLGKVNLSDREKLEIIDTYRENPINLSNKSLHDSVQGRFLFIGKK